MVTTALNQNRNNFENLNRKLVGGISVQTDVRLIPKFIKIYSVPLPKIKLKLQNFSVFQNKKKIQINLHKFFISIKKKNFCLFEIGKCFWFLHKKKNQNEKHF